MGDRANIHVKTRGRKGIFLYTHWGGSDLPQVLSAALERGRSCWDDDAYLARIIFCEMVKNDVRGIRGYGISTYVVDGEDRIIEVEVDPEILPGDQKITIGDRSWTFEEFIKQKPRW